MQNEISKQDIINVAKSINKNVSESQINWILENYNSHQKEDPKTNWSLIVENMLYALPLMEKQFNLMYNVGRAKYVINYHDGIDTHSDGSLFFGIRLFSNKRLFEKAQKDLIKQGYKQTN
jgi:hypothetical protein